MSEDIWINLPQQKSLFLRQVTPETLGPNILDSFLLPLSNFYQVRQHNKLTPTGPCPGVTYQHEIKDQFNKVVTS